MVPPVQSPDEHSHLIRAWLISRGELTLQTPPGQSSGGQVDKALLDFVDVYLSTVTVRADARLTPAQTARVQSLHWGGEQKFFPVPGTGYYLPLVYAPHAAALAAARALDISVADSYRLTRAFTLLACAGLLLAAFRILAPPPLALALLLLPMTLFQLVSPTLDGLTTCMAVLALSLFCRSLLNPAAHSRTVSWLLAATVFMLAGSRIQLLPLLGMPFWLAWQQRSRRDAWLGLAALLLSLLWVGWALTHTVDLRVVRAQSTGQLLQVYATDPTAFVQVVLRSLRDPVLGKFYAESFIGILGWLDTRLPDIAYGALWVGLGVSAVLTLPGTPLHRALMGRLLLLLAAAGSAALVFLALLVTWTPHPALTVAGVQGRYFIVPALVLAYAIGASHQPAGPRWLFNGWLAVFTVASLAALLFTVWGRYH